MALPVNKRVLKILFILFVVAFCVYLVPRVAINFFYYPDDKLYGPDPWSAESVEFTAKDGTRLQGWFIPFSTGPADNAIATIIHAHGNAGNMSAHWPLVSWLPEARGPIAGPNQARIFSGLSAKQETVSSSTPAHSPRQPA